MINDSNPTKRRYANGIDYLYEYLEDGWIAIYQCDTGMEPRPLIQACNEEKADDYIALRERITVPISRIC